MAMESGSNVSHPTTETHGTNDAVTSREFYGAAEDFIPLLSDDSDDAGFVGRASVYSNQSVTDPLMTLAPWKTEELLDFEAAPILSIQQELRLFSEYMAPSRAEHQVRLDIVGRIAAIVHARWPDARVEVYGSFSTGLYLPISDIDLVVFRNFEDPTVDMHQLADLIRQSESMSCVEHIATARVPIIKFVDKSSRIPVDICFNAENALEARDLVKGYLRQFPSLRPLTLFLKYFMYCRNLNETYYGGIGSYLLQLMIVSSLQDISLRNDPKYVETANLGSLLLNFFDLYGRRVNYVKVGISLRQNPRSTGGGFYFDKTKRPEFYDPERPFLLALQNPLDPTHDVGRNSYHIMRVVTCFRWAFDQLLTRGSHPFAPTRLSRIVTVSPEFVARRIQDDVPVGAHVRQPQEHATEEDPSSCFRHGAHPLTTHRYSAVEQPRARTWKNKQHAGGDGRR